MNSRDRKVKMGKAKIHCMMIQQIDCNRKIKHDFPFINICKVPGELFIVNMKSQRVKSICKVNM